MTSMTGLAVGTLRWITKYPRVSPGFIDEINSGHVDPTYVLHTLLISAISVSGGACLGPELALVRIIQYY